MGTILEDLKRDDRSVYCNGWNWQPTVELLRLSGLFDRERLEMMGYNGCTEVSEGEARAVARFMEENVLPALRPGNGMMLNGSTTDVPGNGASCRKPSELFKNSSESEEWLRRFVDFCKICQGFRVW
jgi:hypothetical protein